MSLFVVSRQNHNESAQKRLLCEYSQAKPNRVQGLSIIVVQLVKVPGLSLMGVLESS